VFQSLTGRLKTCASEASPSTLSSVSIPHR